MTINWYKTQNTNAGIHTLSKAKKDSRHSGRGAKTTVPDSHILDMRHRSEVLRETHTQIVKAYPQYNNNYVRNILGYILRPNLKPEPLK